MDWMSPTKQEKFDEKVDRLCRWHRWYAWHPVKLYNPIRDVHHRVWLQYVGRRKELYDQYTGEYGCKDGIGNADYCYEEDLVANKLKYPEIRDTRREAEHNPWKQPSPTNLAAMRGISK